MRDFILKIPHIYVCFPRELHSSNMIHTLYVFCSNNHSRMTSCKYHIILKSQFKSSKNNLCKVYPKDTSLICSTESSRRGKMHSEKQNDLIFAMVSVKVHDSAHLMTFSEVLCDLLLLLSCFMKQISPQRNEMVHIFIFTTCMEFQRPAKHSK